MLPQDLLEHPLAIAIESWDPAAIVDGRLDRGETTLVIEPGKIGAVCEHLKSRHHFLRLSGVTAVDRHPMEPRFEVVYHLHSIERNERLRLKCLLPGQSPEIGSVTTVYPTADWYEREVYDLFGVTFLGHPDLRRLMLPDGYEGHPLRKDFPTHGYKYSYQDQG